MDNNNEVPSTTATPEDGIDAQNLMVRYCKLSRVIQRLTFLG